MRGILKGFKLIAQIFVYKEPEMEIGYPTDVKHVAHIGYSNSASVPSWMAEFKTASDFSFGIYAGSGEIPWVSQVFVYQPNQDSVLQVDKDAYNNCNTSSFISKFDDGNTVFTFTRSGPFYFISGVDNNCKRNESLVVVVMADRSKSALGTNQSSPSPSPTPLTEAPSPPLPPPPTALLSPPPPPLSSSMEAPPSPAPTEQESYNAPPPPSGVPQGNVKGTSC